MSWIRVTCRHLAPVIPGLVARDLFARCGPRTTWACLCAIMLVSNITTAADPAAARTETEVPAYVVKSWQTADGLPQNSVGAIAQTPDGYLWIGTRGGLARFDGVRFRVYGLADGLKSLSILALLEDGEGGLWIATRGGGLSHWRHGVITTLTTADGLAHNDVFAIARDGAGGLWVGTRRGLQHFGADGFKRIGEAEGVGSAVSGIAVSPADGVWFNQEGAGLFHYQGGRCEEVEPAAKSRRLYPSSLLVDAAGALWLGMGNGVVLRRHEGGWREFNSADGVPFSYIHCLAQGQSGEIWAGSAEEGLYVFRGGRFHAVGGMDAAIRAVMTGRNGTVWVGTQTGGLVRLGQARVKSYSVGDASNHGQINGLVEDPAGRFWVATLGGGLFRGKLDSPQPVPQEGELVDTAFVSAGLRARDGMVYFAGHCRVLRVDPGTGEFRATKVEDNPRCLCEGADGTIWLGTNEGDLQCLVNGTPQAVTNGTFSSSIMALVRETGPALWLATQGAGLIRWDAGKVRRWTTADGLPTDILLSLHWDTEGTLWIGTAGGGLAWLEKDQLHALNARQGLGDDVISQILSDDSGNLWLGCNRGIIRVSKRELRSVAAGESAAAHPLILDESDGLVTAECTGGYSPAGWRSPSGKLYFSTVRTIVAVDPARIAPAEDAPAVLIEDVNLDGKRVPTQTGSLTVPPGTRELEIHFTAFNYAKPEQIRFRYRLGGKDWTEIGRERSVRFSQLHPGNYAFELSAANQDGRWQDPGVRLAFQVQPSFWQTPWFQAVVLASLVGFGGLTTWWEVRRRHRRTVAELNRTNQQQAEVAHVGRLAVMGELTSSLAHELNQPIGAILRNAEAAEIFLQNPSPDLDEIRAILADIRSDNHRAGAVIDRIRSMVKRRPFKSEVVDFHRLAVEVIQLVRPDAGMRNVHLTLEPVSSLPQVRGDRIQLQQVLLNLIINAMDALKDSTANDRRVTVRIQAAGSHVEVAVCDSGHGIPPEMLAHIFDPFFTTKPNGMGMGLPICLRIIEAHAGKLWAENNSDGGASFHVSLPVAKTAETW